MHDLFGKMIENPKLRYSADAQQYQGQFQIPNSVLDNFEIFKKENPTYKITSFNQIGISNPFPNEKQYTNNTPKFPECASDYVYDLSRFRRN